MDILNSTGCPRACDSVSGGMGASGAWLRTMVVEAPCRSAWTYTSPLLRSSGGGGAAAQGVAQHVRGDGRLLAERMLRRSTVLQGQGWCAAGGAHRWRAGRALRRATDACLTAGSASPAAHSAARRVR